VIQMQADTIAPQRKQPALISPVIASFPAKTKSCCLLEKFVPQDRPGIGRELKANESKAMLALSESYVGFVEAVTKSTIWGKGLYQEFYDYCLPFAHDARIRGAYTSGDIDIFIGQLPKIEVAARIDVLTGIFLSALINHQDEQDCALHIDKAPFPLSFLSMMNQKNVAIYGDSGYRLALRMGGGKIAFHGNAFNHAGEDMTGGKLCINGRTGSYLGFGMTGGEILMKGEALDCGNAMQGGKICIIGSVRDDVGKNMSNGEILVKGNVLGDVGGGMTGGAIKIVGNVLGVVGAGMHDGTIIVNGSIASLWQFDKNRFDPHGNFFPGGNVIQYGRQLVKDGNLSAQPEKK